jgi:hypothetical protein
MILPHIIAVMNDEEQRLSPALPLRVFREEDRKPLESVHSYRAPNQGAEFSRVVSFSIEAPEPAHVWQIQMWGQDDDDSEDV